MTERLQDAFFLSNFVYSPDKKILVPAKTSGHPGKTGVARFLLLRDGAVYFQGTEKLLVSTQDPYLRSCFA